MEWRRLLGLELKFAKKRPSLYSQVGPAWARLPPINTALWFVNGYAANPIVHDVVRRIADAVCGVKLCLYDKQEKEVDCHPILDMLDSERQVRGFVIDRIVTGTGTLVAAAAGARIYEVYRLPIQQMKADIGRDAIIRWRRLPSEGGVEEVYEAADVLCWSSYHPVDPVYGMSPLQPALVPLQTINDGGRWNLALIQNGARPSGALVMPSDAERLDERAYKQLKQELEGAHSGPDGSGKPLLLEGGLTWQEMGQSPKDMDFQDSILEAKRDICRAFGMPPMLIGIPGDNTYANYQEANRALHTDTIQPLVKSLAAALNAWPALGLRAAGLCLKPDWDSSQAMAEIQREVYGKLEGVSFITANEKRDQVGYEPHVGGDNLYASAAMVPIGQANDEPTSTGDDAADLALAYGDGLDRPADATSEDR